MRLSFTPIKSGFTLIELLIVIGILSILVVTILITLNPAEAQKKTRDAKRMKDRETILSILNQYLQDGNSPPITSCLHPDAGNSGRCESTNSGPQKGLTQPCNNNFLQIDLCAYTNSVPIDPINHFNPCSIIVGGTVVNPTIDTNQFACRYWVRMIGSDVNVGVMQESRSNAANVLSDGGIYSHVAETGSNLSMGL